MLVRKFEFKLKVDFFHDLFKYNGITLNHSIQPNAVSLT